MSRRRRLLAIIVPATEPGLRPHRNCMRPCHDGLIHGYPSSMTGGGLVLKKAVDIVTPVNKALQAGIHTD